MIVCNMLLLMLAAVLRAEDCEHVQCAHVQPSGTLCRGGTLGEQLCIANGSVVTYPSDACVRERRRHGGTTRD